MGVSETHMQQLKTWKAQLETELRMRRSGVTVEERDGCLYLFVSSESEAQVAWSSVDAVDIPDAVIRVFRPIAFLAPYPGGDARNEAAFQQFIERNTRIGENGEQLLLSGLDPVVGPAARVLVLGSMPGAMSLERGEYYAHPRNRFWKVMQRVFSIPTDAPYLARTAALTRAGVALWDVLRHCARAGSLDRNIDPGTEVPNDVATFLRSNPSIRSIVLNGRKAEQSFRRWIGDDAQGVDVVVLPSTSAANAGVSIDELTERWRAALL